MIKFFRHIRKSLLMENKTGQYLKYAIGEIFLVVIGILIALQINNWNEERKIKNNEIVLLKKLQEENTVNIKSMEDYIDIRQEIPDLIEEFIDLLGEKSLETKETKIKNKLSQVLESAAYTFIQSSLINYINTHNSKNSVLSKELSTLEASQNDLELSSSKGLDIKIKYLFEGLENDVDFNSLDITSFDTFKSLKFKNNMFLIYQIEYEISSIFDETYKQMIKVDSLITEKLKQ